jgi:hypothetical protein
MDALAVLQRLGSGRLLEDIHDALVTTAQEVVATGKAGKVTVTLNVSTMNQGDVLVTIEEMISRTAPKRDPRGAIFYAVDGALHREDPRQVRMDFRTVDTETGEIREVEDKGRVERVI